MSTVQEERVLAQQPRVCPERGGGGGRRRVGQCHGSIFIPILLFSAALPQSGPQAGIGPWCPDVPAVGGSSSSLQLAPHNLPSLNFSPRLNPHSPLTPHYSHPPRSSPGTLATQPTHAIPWPLTCGPGVSACPCTCSPLGASN